jgi:hypothetical protein
MHQAPLPVSTRREFSALRKRTLRKRYAAATAALAAAAVMVGTGFVVQANAGAADGAAKTALLASGTGLSRDHLDVYPAIAKAQADMTARSTIDDANQVIASVQNKVDATPLVTSVASLANYGQLDRDEVLALVQQTAGAKAAVQAAASQADQAAETAAAEAVAKLAQANTPDGAKATARTLASSLYGWGDEQFSCLVSLWQKESGWNYQASNASSGAAGIPQALPGSKMASVGSDWESNATTQVTWGLDYIKRGYGTPCSAWSHSQSVNWY